MARTKRATVASSSPTAPTRPGSTWLRTASICSRVTPGKASADGEASSVTRLSLAAREKSLADRLGGSAVEASLASEPDKVLGRSIGIWGGEMGRVGRGGRGGRLGGRVPWGRGVRAGEGEGFGPAGGRTDSGCSSLYAECAAERVPEVE